MATNREVFRDLLAALEDWSEANAEYRRKREVYDGPSVDYVLRWERDQADAATDRLADALHGLLDLAVRRALEGKS